MFLEYFQKLGFSKKQGLVFQALYTLGSQPASVIAQYVGLERTSTYKILKRLRDEDLVQETFRGGVKHFFILSPQVLETYSKKKQANFEKLTEDYSLIEKELKELGTSQNISTPKISLFDGNAGIQNIYGDIITNIESHGYINVRLFMSNVVESQTNISREILASREYLFSNLRSHNISLETFLGNGIMLMENMSKIIDITDISEIPASNSGIQIFLVGDTIYIILLKDIPFGIKIKSFDLANTLHFLFDNMNYSDR